MYYVNKIVWFLLNPLTIALALVLAGMVCAWRVRVRAPAVVFALAGALWLWVWSTPLFTLFVGLPLEARGLRSDGSDAPVESYPACDAIVVLGGGMGRTEGMRHPEMFAAADRVWHGARLWKAGRAPVVLLSGCAELESSVPLLLDLGVPRERILVDNESRNTYENARFTEDLLRKAGRTDSPRVLLVTSAAHMPRACGNFAKTGLHVVPAPTDFEATAAVRSTRRKGLWAFVLPDVDCLACNVRCAKEWLGRLARK